MPDRAARFVRFLYRCRQHCKSCVSSQLVKVSAVVQVGTGAWRWAVQVAMEETVALLLELRAQVVMEVTAVLRLVGMEAAAETLEQDAGMAWLE